MIFSIMLGTAFVNLQLYDFATLWRVPSGGYPVWGRCWVFRISQSLSGDAVAADFFPKEEKEKELKKQLCLPVYVGSF